MDVNKKFLEELGTRIATRRKELGLTQTEVGRHLGCSQSLVAAYESGERRIPVSFIPVVSRVLDISVNELLDVEERTQKRKRGPPPKLQQRFERVQQLPRAQQQVVLKMLDGLLEQTTRKSAPLR